MEMQSCVVLTLIVLLSISSCSADLNYVEHNQTMRIDLYQKVSTNESGLTSNADSQRTNNSIPLYSYLNQEFYGTIAIGRPGQTLNVAFDTTWTYTWVLSSECSGLGNIGCYYHNKYNHQKSSEYKPDGRKFSVNLGSYNLTGFYSYDNITISQSKVTNFSFVEIVEVPRTFILNKADGIVGLGLKVDKYEPLFYGLYRQKRIRDNFFSVYFNRNGQSSMRGSIMLGFIDRNLTRSAVVNGRRVYDTIQYSPVDPLSYWQFNMDRIVMVYNSTKNFTFCANGCKAMIHTSSPTIVGPAKDVAEIHKNIKAEKFMFDKYSVDCKKVNSLPKINFRVGNKTFTLSGPSYITRVSYGLGTVCLSSFQGAATSRWILGGTFLSEVYTVYDVAHKRIGLVHAA